MLEQKAGVKQGNTGYTMHTWEGARDGMNAWTEADSGSWPFSGLRSVVGAGWESPRLNEFRLRPLFNTGEEVFPPASSGVCGGEAVAQNKARG